MSHAFDLFAGNAHQPRLVTIRQPHILLFDSGLGGLTVHREVARLRPDARYTYLADDAGFPYGDWQEAPLIARIVEVIGQRLRRDPADCVVIACNTASTLALPALRAAFAMPFVGTVPAIKPAAERTRSGLVSVLATPGTVARDYTRDLIERFASHCQVTLVGSRKLAGLAEAAMRGEAVPNAAILPEIAPCFVEDGGQRTDVVTLSCTHYPLLRDRFERLAPWPVTWIDPAPAIARRVVELIGPPAADRPGTMEAVFTGAGRLPDAFQQFTRPPGTAGRAVQ